MTTQPVEANVVLTTDNSQYDQAMIASAQSTNNLGLSVDSLGKKIDSLSKRAGKTLIGITAADVATITGATAAWASYEKQVERLKAQSAVLTRSTDQQTKLMKNYEGAVKSLRVEFGTTTTEAARLVQTLSKVTDMRQSRSLTDLSKVFQDMSLATGENADGLASSLTNLQRIMGTPINAKTSKDYADTFTYLAARTNTSATELANFTSQLAPMGESMGMNMKQVAGFATAFTRAGADGQAAATVFAKVTSDISKSVATGSPEVKTYANLLGMSAPSFEHLDAGEKLVKIFEALNKQGPQAATFLERQGLEGPRTQRAIQSMIQQAGGVREALNMAQSPDAAGASTRGSGAVMDNVTEQLGQLRQEAQMTAESMATIFGPALEDVLKVLVKLSENMEELISGPFGEFLQGVMGITSIFTSGAGAMLLFAGALLKVATAFAAVRSSGAYGLREGLGGGQRMMRGPDGTYVAAPGPGGRAGALGARGAEIAEGGRWTQAYMYNTGQAIGGTARGLGGLMRQGYISGRQAWDPSYQAAPMRGPLSYAMGGAGRAMDWFYSPQFDQMGKRNAAERTSYFGQQFATGASPGERVRAWGQASRLSDSMGAVQRHQDALLGARQQELGVRRDATLGAQERQEKLANIAASKEEIKTRLAAAHEQQRIAKVAVAATAEETAARQREVIATGEASVGATRFGRAALGAAAAMGRGVAGAGAAGGRALMESRFGSQAAGMAGVTAMGALGIENNTLMYGSMGAMIGGLPGAAAGAGLGVAIDMAGANNKVTDSLKALQEQATETGRSGVGLPALSSGMKDSQKAVDDMKKSLDSMHPHDLVIHPVKFESSVKNFVEGVFGSSDIEELQRDHDRIQKSFEKTSKAVRDLGDAVGKDFTGSSDNQLQQMEEWMSSEGAQALSSIGMTFDEFAKAQAKGGKAYTDLLSRLNMPIPAGLSDQLRQSPTGAAMLDSPAGRESLKYQADIGVFYKATHSVFQDLLKSGMSYREIIKSAAGDLQRIGVGNNRESEFAMSLIGQAQQAQQFQQPFIGRAATFRQAVGGMKDLMGVDTSQMSDEMLQLMDQQKQTTAQTMASQAQYEQQMLMALDQFNIQRSRGEDDYNLQRSYQEQDFQLSRERGEEAYERNRKRAVQEYNLGMRRAHREFDIQRRRSEADYNHQVELMAKQTAQGAYNAYERIQVEQTSSAEWLISNMQEQNKAMVDQEKNLQDLRKRGVTDAAIQRASLTDPGHAQELERLVTELNPQLIAQLNQAGAAGEKAGKALATDESSQSWQEMERQHALTVKRGAADFDRQMNQSDDDFHRHLRQQDDDFELMMRQQLDDYQRGMGRQANAYKLQMDRSAEDFANMAKEINMSMEQILIEGAAKLPGLAGKQAKQVLTAFENLKGDASAEAIATMQELASIFGFEYKLPKEVVQQQQHPGHNQAQYGPGQQALQYATGQADGGVIPGWSPGRDDRMVPLSGGEAIMRPEWARAIGDSTIQAMNHQAKYGGFASGGVYWPVPGHDTSTYPGHDGVDINRGSGSDDLGDPIRAFRSGTITYVGTGHGYGEAIFEKTKAGTVVYGHTSQQYVTAGQQVGGGDLIGAVGSTGNSSAPHLHFGIPGGSYQQAMDLLAGAMLGVFSGPATQTQAADVQTQALAALKDWYPQAEKAAHAMMGVHPLAPGQITQVINKLARRSIRRMRRQSGFADQPVASSAPGLGQAPESGMTNQQIVRTGANRLGWGDQWNALSQLVSHESGFNNTAQNPTSTAYGMFQFLDSTWPDDIPKTSDPWKQTQAGLRYIKDRYGDPNGAWDFWQDHNWYKNGAVFNGRKTIGVGEDGPEAVIPLNAKGAEFMSDVMARSVGMVSTPSRGGVQVNATRIDRSTNFTGPITVQANDPQELIAKLQARQRVMALSRPTTTGTAA